MITKRPIFRELASLLNARSNCVKSNNIEWYEKYGDKILEIMSKYSPSGSCIDCGTELSDISHENKLVFTFSFHHMDENGFYDDWTDYEAIVTPSLAFRYDIKITGMDRNYIKDYLYDLFRDFLDTEIEIGYKED